MRLPAPITHAVELLQSLPGIGPRSAERLTYFLLRMPQDRVLDLAESLRRLKSEIQTCQECFNFSEDSRCTICQDSRRDRGLLMVVEEPLDVVAVEKSGKYAGFYHVLGGVIDPVRGIGAGELRVNELIGRIRENWGRQGDQGGAIEVIMATNPSTEGETTAAYLKKILQEQLPSGSITITRIARGLPVGGDLEYADPVTLSRSLEGRREY